MGMFDTVAVSDPLPFIKELEELGLAKNDWSLQTKDFNRALDLYVVQGGKLHLRGFASRIWVEGDPKAKSVFNRMGYFENGNPYLELVKFTGQFRAYDFRLDVEPHWDVWVEWDFTAVDGEIKDVKLVRFEKTNNTERKARAKELFERIERENALWYNRLFFHTRPMRWVGLKWFNLKIAVSNFFSK
jgi:hypothetical protein